MTQPVPPILYKYMSSARIGFFDTPQLRFTPPAEFNDDFECILKTTGLCEPAYMRDRLLEQIKDDSALKKHLCDQLVELSGSPRSIFEDFLTPQILSMLRNEYQSDLQDSATLLANCLATDLSAKKLLQLHESAQNKANMGVLCLTPDKNNPAMWGNYTPNPQGHPLMGFVVGFDTSNPFFDRRLVPYDPFRHLVPVQYPKQRPQRYLSDYDDMDNGRKALAEDIYYTKHHKWEAENEWRMVISIAEDPDAKILGLEDIPVEMIKEVYLASRSDDVLAEAAKKFCSKHDVRLFKMRPNKLEESFEPMQLF